MRAAKVASQLRSAKAEAGPDAIRDELSAARARSSALCSVCLLSKRYALKAVAGQKGIHHERAQLGRQPPRDEERMVRRQGQAPLDAKRLGPLRALSESFGHVVLTL